MFVIYIIFDYKSFISNPIYSANFVLFLLALVYFSVLYTFFVIKPIIKEQGQEQEN